MNIRMKLYIGFSFMGLLIVIVAAIAYFNVNNLKSDVDIISKDRLPKLLWSNNINKQLNSAAVLLRNAILTDDENLKKMNLDKIGKCADVIQFMIDSLKVDVKNEKGKKLLAELEKSRLNYIKQRILISNLILDTNRSDILNLLFGELEKAQNKYFNSAEDIFQYQTYLINSDITAIKQNSESLLTIFIFATCIATLIGILVSTFMSNRITSPIKKAVNAAEEVSKGNMAINFDTKSKDETGILLNSMKIMADNISSVINELNRISEATVLGKLDQRGNVNAFQGDYREIVKGFNATLDAVIHPLNMTAEYVDRISKGDIPPKITDNYKGDFNEIKNNLNQCIDAINLLVTDSAKLADSAINGKLDSRADVTIHYGSFRSIIQGVNDTLDNVIGPLNVAAEYVDRISKGDIPPKITENYKGDFNEIKNNLNQCIDAVHLLVNDTQFLVSAAVQEKFEVRADADMHFGDFRKIINGVNSTLDTVVNKIFWYEQLLDAIPSPVSVTDMNMNWTFINKAAEGVAGKTRKDVTGKHCSNWGANICGTEKCGVHGLRNGKATSFFNQPGLDMEFRVDSAYILNGNGEKIGHIEVVNDITEISNNIKKIERIAEYQKNETVKLIWGLNEIAKGNFDVTVTFEKPDENTQSAFDTMMEIKAGINTFIDSVLALRDDVVKLSVAAADGKLDSRADISRHHGDFRFVIEGVNYTLDNIIRPLNVAAEYVDRISKGDIPPKITDNYKGDFNEIKNNLNQCISAIDLMVSDALMLVAAAETGTLEKRADAIRHEGNFRKIIDGFNKTLDLVVGPIEETSMVMSVFATGDLTVRILNEYNGDFAKLKNDVNTFSDSLSNLISQLNDAIQNTASAAHEISSTAESLAAASQEQSAQADEVAGAVESMSKTITQNAMGAGRTAEVATKNSFMASESGKVVEQTVNKMKDIALVVKNSAVNIEQLGESSKEIGEIISVIDDIADQTNLLALNAAIEAARAGEQGRGFAVVADEVRKLAERTTNATKQIAKMIKGIQKETEAAVIAMNKGTIEVQSGIELADKAGDSLKQILNSTHEVLAMVNQIAVASEEQSASSEQISKNVIAISKVTADSAVRVEDVAKTADSLANMTEQLRNIISTFKVEESYSYTGTNRILGNRDEKRLPAGR